MGFRLPDVTLTYFGNSSVCSGNVTTDREISPSDSAVHVNVVTQAVIARREAALRTTAPRSPRVGFAQCLLLESSVQVRGRAQHREARYRLHPTLLSLDPRCPGHCDTHPTGVTGQRPPRAVGDF